MPVTAGLSLGVALHMMWVDGEESALVVLIGSSDQPQGDLQVLGLGHCVLFKQFVDGLIGGQERQPVSQFESFLAQTAGFTHSSNAQRRFMNELKGQPWSDGLGFFPGPNLEQVPRPKAEMFGNQEPYPRQRSRHLVGEQLAYTSLQADRVAR